MKASSEKGKHIQLSISQVHHVEAFVEHLCDQYNINNAYFGHMMFAVTEMFSQACQVANHDHESIHIQFESDRNALRFNFYLGVNYAKLSAKCLVAEEILLNQQELNENEEGFLAVNLLCDDIRLYQETFSIELVFNTSSINKVLRNRRVKALESYYEGLFVQNKV